jgi:putative endopeptidase
MNRPVLLALLLATAACSGGGPGTGNESSAARTAGSEAGIVAASMDKAVAPGDDFFAYANGN